MSSKSVATSFFVHLCRPISPTPSTSGLSRNSGSRAITSLAKAVFSASLALMPTQQ